MIVRLKLRSDVDYGFPHLALAGFTALIVYLGCALFVLDPAAVWSPDEGAKLLQLRSLRWEDQRLHFDIAYAGRALDPALDFAVLENPSHLLSPVAGYIVMERLPVLPLLALPFYRLAGMRGLYLLPALAGALIAPLALALIGRGERKRLAWPLAWGLISFGSPVFIYSILFWEHTPATALALGGALAVFQVCFGADQKRAQRAALALLAAALLSAAAYLRLETGLLSAALLGGGWLLAKGRRPWLAGIAAGVGLALLAYLPLHAELLEGGSLPSNVRYLYRPLAYLKSDGWLALRDLLVGPPKEEGLDTGWMGLVLTGAALLVAGGSAWPRQNSTTRKIVYGGLALGGLAALDFFLSPTPYRAAHGLLFTTPWALLGMAYARQVWTESSSRTKALLLTTAFGLLAYTLAMIGVRGSSPHGGLEWGARFALPFYPLLAILIAWGWKAESGIPRLIASFLICLGFAFQVRGLLTIREDKQINAALNRAIQATPEANVVTDLWWLLPNAAPFYPSKAIYSAASPTEIAAWAIRARTQGVDSFDLVTLDYALPAAVKANLPGYELRIRELIVIKHLLVFRIRLEQSPREGSLHPITPCKNAWR
jgi:hypothetical protein